ncbi:UNVERIFIED_CONTAM: hypothetical protein K2H54_042237 [Gekko kuhli]
MERKRQGYIHELIQTEEKYMDDLQLVVEVFQKRMAEAGCLSEAEMGLIFVNWKELIVSNTKLLNSFSAAIEKGRVSSELKLSSASSGIGATGQKGHKRENGTDRPVVAASTVEPGRHRFRDVDVDVASPPAGRNRNVGTEQLRRREVAPAVSETPAKQASAQNTPQKRSLPPKRSKPVDSASEAPLGTGASAPRRLRCRRAVAASSSFAFHSEPARRRRDAFAVDGSCSAPEVDAVSADSAPIDFGTTALLRAVAVPGDLPASPVLLS